MFPKELDKSFLVSIGMSLLSAVLVGVYLAESIFSAEFFGALAMGHWITTHFAVPREELWLISESGSPLIYPEWLFAASLSLVESAFGELGLYSYKLMVFVAFTCALSMLCSLVSREAFFGTLIAVIASCGVLLGADLNPAMISVLLFTLSLLIFSYGFSTERRITWLLLLFSLGLIYTNVSSTYILSLLLFAFLLQENKERSGFLFPLLCYLSPAFLSPYLGAQLPYSLSSLLQGFFIDATSKLSAVTLFYYPAAFLLLLWMLFAVFLRYSPPLSKSFIVYISGVVSLLAFASRPLVPYALILTAVSLSQIWGSRGIEVLGNLDLGLTSLREKLARLPAFGLSWVLSCLIFINVYNGITVPVANLLMPAREVDFVLDERLALPLLHEPQIGGYVQYRFSDVKGDFLSQIASAPRLQSLNPELWQKAAGVEGLREGWRDYFKAISPESVICRASSPLAQLLSESPDWEQRFSGRLDRLRGTGSASQSRGRMPLASSDFSWLVFSKAS